MRYQFIQDKYNRIQKPNTIKLLENKLKTHKVVFTDKQNCK